MAFTPSPAEPERRVDPLDPSLSQGAPGPAAATAASAAAQDAAWDAASEGLSTAELIEQLQADRLWLLRQIDGGAYPELRLDLAALERELGQLLDQAGERVAGA